MHTVRADMKLIPSSSFPLVECRHFIHPINPPCGVRVRVRVSSIRQKERKVEKGEG